MRIEKKLAAVLAVLCFAGSVFATDTTITIPDMECKGCAGKVARVLTTVAGVASVQTNVEARTAVVKPKPQATPSPKAMWEALEKIDKEPSKLEGPAGTFTAKPQS